MLKVLLQSRKVADQVTGHLAGHEIEVLKDPSNVFIKVIEGNYDLVILEDETIISAVSSMDPRTEIFVLCDCQDAIEAIKKGATACFTAPVDAERFRKSLESVSEQVNVCNETDELERRLVEKYTFAGVVARNPQMLDVFRFLRKIAPYYKAVTIMGETGTGKEAIAKALHSISPWAKLPFVACNCGGLVESLVESEFFGHVKGAFTGADSDKTGVFEAAGEGVVFLDEIGDLPVSFQPHLLRVLQNGEFRKLGSHKVLKASCRVIAATNKDLAEEVREGRFREDLYYRLTPFTINIPPLRERKDDIQLLCRFILDRFQDRNGKRMSGISRPAQKALMYYDWPGNVRELENVIEHAAILASETYIKDEHLPRHIGGKKTFQKTDAPRTLDDFIREHISSVLKECNGNRSQAARLLGISRGALLRKLARYSIE